jgi:crotonobetainyl-CoA:carnitine CoA-transferase CaiB-like acyl-CoA transferase
MLLGDYGADVIKVEPPRGDWGRTMGTSVGPDNGTTYLSVNRNKRSLCLDMKDDRGRAVAARLAGRSDIVVESFRPGVMDRLGLGYETLAADNPRLIYCSISGYGQDGPNAGLPAGDSTMQAYGGLMSVIGEPGRQPLRVGNVVSDMLTGMNAFQGVMMALLTLEKTGKGRRVALNLMDSLMAFLAPPLTEYMVTGNVPDRIGNAHPLLGPSGAMQTADGHIVVTVLDHQWPAFCERLGIEAAQADPRFATSPLRVENRAALEAILAPVFAEKTSADWLALLRALDIPCAPINDFTALRDDPQVRHNQTLGSADHPTRGPIPMVRNPVRIDGIETACEAPPVLGEHGREILLGELGYNESEADALIEAGVVIEGDVG